MDYESCTCECCGKTLFTDDVSTVDITVIYGEGLDYRCIECGWLWELEEKLNN